MPMETCRLCGRGIWRAATRKHKIHGKVHLKCYVKLLEDTIRLAARRPGQVLFIEDSLAK